MVMEPQRYIFEMPMKVRDYEVDSQGIVNNANYQIGRASCRERVCQYV